MKNEKNFFKTKPFFEVFISPSLTWLVISLLLIIFPDEEYPVTLGELIIVDIVIIYLWFLISLIITLIVWKVRKNKQQKLERVNSPTIKRKKTDAEIQEETRKNKEKRHSNFVTTFMTILFAITLMSLFGSLATIAGIDILFQDAESVIKEKAIALAFWIWLPVPVLSIILGFKYKKAGFKCTKNIVGGFIIGFYLFTYGFLGLLPNSGMDYFELYPYRSIVEVSLPNNGRYEKLYWPTYVDTDKINYTNINIYYDKANVENFVKEIKNNPHWISGDNFEPELEILLPSAFQVTSDCYISIYIKEIKKYNTLPEVAGNYEVYIMKYDISDKKLEIHKFDYFYNK